MMAVIELRYGGIASVVGLRGTFSGCIPGILETYPYAERIWCVRDELGEEWDPNEEPFWEMLVIEATGYDGKTAIIEVEALEDDDLWDTVLRTYPLSYDLIKLLDIVPRGWKAVDFSAGDDRALAAYLSGKKGTKKSTAKKPAAKKSGASKSIAKKPAATTTSGKSQNIKPSAGRRPPAKKSRKPAAKKSTAKRTGTRR